MRSGGIPSRATPGIHPASPTQPTADAAQLALAAALLGGSPSPCTMPTSSLSVICDTSACRSAWVSVPVSQPCPLVPLDPDPDPDPDPGPDPSAVFLQLQSEKVRWVPCGPPGTVMWRPLGSVIDAVVPAGTAIVIEKMGPAFRQRTRIGP